MALNRRQALLGGSALIALSASGAGCAASSLEVQQRSNPGGSPPLNADWGRADAIIARIETVDIPRRDFYPADYAGEDGFVAETDVRAPILAAIEAAHTAGGGRVVLPEGKWLSDGPIVLKSNVELHLKRGAHLQFLPNPESYLPAVMTRWEGTEVYTYSPFIHAREAENVALTGDGKIDGQGEQYWLPWRKTQEPIKKELRDMGRDGVAVEERMFVGDRRLRPYFIQFWKCRRVLVDGLTLVDSPFWMVHPLYCSDVVVRNLTCISQHINSDGVDPDSSRRVLIENCNFDVGDDGVALKSGRDQDGWRVGMPCEDIVIRNCIYSGGTGGAVAIGSEMSGGVKGVFIENWSVPKAHHTLYFKANLDRGGLIEDVHIRNIVAGTVETLIIFTNDYHSYRGGNYPPSFETMTISGVTCDVAGTGISIKGHERAPVRNIAISDVRVGEVGIPLEMAETEAIHLSNVVMNGKTLSPDDAVGVSGGKSH